MIDKIFVTAGQAIFTVSVPEAFCAEHPECQTHYTYRVVCKEADENGPEVYFVSLLTGPNNTRDYSYLGILNPKMGTVRLTKASRFAVESWPVKILSRVLARVWHDEGELVVSAGWDCHHEGKCARCGRALTTPMSVQLGIGPECIKQLW